jgi:endonuclease/exonuclease/phosphatase (EEP) superfamily protein YafD
VSTPDEQDEAPQTPASPKMPGQALFWFGTGATLLVGATGIAGRAFPWLDVFANFAPPALSCDALLFVFWIALPWLRRNSIAAAALLAAVAANSVLAGPEFLRAVTAPARASGDSKTDLKILTFNVWNDSQDRQRTINTILTSGADVVALQEATGFIRFKLLDRLAAVYPYHATCDSWWGCEVVILSRYPIARHGDVLDLDHTKCQLTYLWAEIRPANGTPFTIASTHLGRPWPPQPRACETVKLAAATKRLVQRDLILTGDFNAAGTSATLQQQDRALAPLVRRTLMLPTWPAYLPVWNVKAPFPFLALDHVYAGPDWRTVAVTSLAPSASDHYPVEITLTRGD